MLVGDSYQPWIQTHIQDVHQSAQVASSMLHPPFRICSLTTLTILPSPELSIGCFRNKLKTFHFSQIWCITLLELVVHLLSFHFLLNFIHCLPWYALLLKACDMHSSSMHSSSKLVFIKPRYALPQIPNKKSLFLPFI